MADLKIGITADASQAIQNINSLSDSYAKLGKALNATNGVKPEENAQAFDLIQQKMSKTLAVYKQIYPEQEALAKSVSFLESKSFNLANTYNLTEEQLRSLRNTTDAYREQLKQISESTKQVAVSTEEVSQKTNGFGIKMVSLVKNIVGFRLVMTIFNKVIRTAVQDFRDAIKYAAEAEQVYSKLTTVFDGLSSSMSKAQSLASKLGVATTTAASALSTVGDLLQAQGATTTESLELATKWVEQFQDIIAFKDINMSLEEFAQNFMSGVAGNLRVFRSFGSIVKESAVQTELARQGMDGLTGSALEYQKMIIRANMALEQQANAMGATNREWDTTLSIQRRLNEAQKQAKTNWGEMLNQFINPLREALAEWLEAMNYAYRLTDVGSGISTATFDMSDKKAIKGIVTELRKASSVGGGITPELLSLLMSTSGATGNQIKQIAEDYRISIDERILAEVSAIVSNQKSQLIITENFSKILEKEQSRYSSYLDSIASIKGVNISDRTSEIGNKYTYLDPETGERRIAPAVNGNSRIFTSAQDALSSILSADISSLLDGFSIAIGDFDASDIRAARQNSLQSLYEATANAFIEGGIDTENNPVLEAIASAFNKLTAEELWDGIKKSLGSSFGEIGTLFTLGKNNKAGDPLIDLVNLGMSILSQLEIVGRVSTLISDTVVPLLDAFFAPLVIVLSPLTKMLQNVLSLALQFIFPIIQGLALGINNIVLAINIIVDILKFNWKKVSEDMDEWKQTRNEILAANLETAKNTNKDSELAIYKDLYQRGLLNANEFAGEAARIGYNYGPLGGSSSGWAVSGGQTYYYNNASITIDASGYSKAELRELLEEIVRPGATGFGNN